MCSTSDIGAVTCQGHPADSCIKQQLINTFHLDKPVWTKVKVKSLPIELSQLAGRQRRYREFQASTLPRRLGRIDSGDLPLALAAAITATKWSGIMELALHYDLCHHPTSITKGERQGQKCEHRSGKVASPAVSALLIVIEAQLHYWLVLALPTSVDSNCSARELSSWQYWLPSWQFWLSSWQYWLPS